MIGFKFHLQKQHLIVQPLFLAQGLLFSVGPRLQKRVSLDPLIDLML
jgi:hypothetical protein